MWTRGNLGWKGFLAKHKGNAIIYSKNQPRKRVLTIPTAKTASRINPIAKKGLEAAELKCDLTFVVGGGKM